ncbi:exocyst complex component 1-like isoform X5 [Mauremys mutica]|uniref:exocyst complex component 1-like isoform X5 n=1 Tax=Mauremys mutica TaxID=74926 RepID=UPI001D16AFF3|nr:exocyst complex component 1-like isoform X5 [Mauremys mutica]
MEPVEGAKGESSQQLTMASPWILLEKDVFNPQNERLLEIIHVWKTGKKRKNSILCVVVAACRPIQLFLEKVKKADRGDQYKMTDRWPLKDLKLVDGKNVNQECLEFELQFDKVYKWTAVSADEKKAFIRCLWKLNRRYLSSSIAFVSIPSCMLEGKQSLQEVGNASAETGDQAEHSAYQEMTPKETADMLKLMEEYEPIVNNSMAFAEKLSKDLQVLDEGNGQVPARMQQASELISSTHGPYHDDLLPYTPLMAWLKNANPILFHDLPKVYAWNLSRLYEREIKAFFELARMLLLGRTKECFPEGLDKQVACGSRQHPRFCLADSREGEEDEPDRGNVVKMLEQVLRELQPLCIAEQRFIEQFFMLSQDAAAQEWLGLPATSKGGKDVAFPEKSHWPKTKTELEEQPTQLLSEIFSSLEPELRGFIDTCNKVQQFSCLQVLVTLNDYMFEMQGSSAATSSSFLNVVLSNILLLAKNNFNKCICVLCKEIEEAKVPSKAKGGILPFVSRFEEFVNFSEDVFRWAQQRGELDKAHTKLVGSVFSSINSLASANLKVNTDMVMMENFHHIHCFLYQKKIQCLENKRREAKQRYHEHLERYVTKYLGQPLEKLNHFFEGVKARVALGVKEEEVSFQLAYSKQELRKVIEKYPGKEVKRALDTLYRKIHKYLSPEENLLPVVWRAMEQEFIRQYQEFENLIQRCYPESGITMDFTVEDLLNYFISVTQSSM